MRFTFNPFSAAFRAPTATDILRKQLLDAEASRAEHAANREYHTAMEVMLEERIERIKGELDAAK